MKKVNNKKSVVLLATFSLLLIGVTIAYYFNKTTYKNEFDLSNFETVTTEVFTSPNNWQPGDTTEKLVTVTNNGTVNAAVRACLKERWYNESGGAQGREKAVSFDPDAAVIINSDNDDEWFRVGNCYYYLEPLEPGETTSSFMESVTFNPEFGENFDCELNDNIETCVSDTQNRNGGRYELYITTETVQYSMYREAWKTNVVVTNQTSDPIRFITRDDEDDITTGDLVRIGDNQEFYVVSSDANETVLLARYNINVGKVNPDVTEGIQHESIIGLKDGVSKYGDIFFTSHSYWKNKVGEGLDYPGSYNNPNYPYVYDSNSNIYNHIENYKTILEQVGINIERARLLSYQEATELGCSGNSCSSAPDWVYGTTYWLGSAKSNVSLYTIEYDGNFTSHLIPYAFDDYSPILTPFDPGVRPVIVMNTADL